MHSGQLHTTAWCRENNKTAIQQIVGHELFSFLPPDKKVNIREPKLKSQRVLNINPAAGDRLGMGVVTAATARENTGVARIGYDNDALMSEGDDCGVSACGYYLVSLAWTAPRENLAGAAAVSPPGTWIGGVGAFPATDRDGKSRYGPNSSCTGIDGRGESCGDHAPECFTNECDNRLARSGPRLR